MSSSVDAGFLRDLSSVPQLESQAYFHLPDFATLNRIQTLVVQGICTTLEGADKISVVPACAADERKCLMLHLTCVMSSLWYCSTRHV